MINGIQGIPGAGKSYEFVVFQMLPALQAGRKVITNLPVVVEMVVAMNSEYLPLIEIRRKVQPVRGTWDAERVDDKGNAFELFADGHVEPPDPKVKIFGHVWDYWTDWKHPVTGQGPLFLIDECHVGLHKLRTEPTVVELYKLHRHFNIDITLGTQNFRDINQEIAGIIAIIIRLRKADILGKNGSYIRKVQAGYRGTVIQSEEREYKPQYFPLYKSHTQGNSVMESVAQDVSPYIVKFRRMTRFVFIFVALAAVAVAYYYWQKPATGKMKTVKTVSVGPPPGYVAPPAAKASEPTNADQAASRNEQQPTAVDDVPEPYQNKTLHLNGFITMKGKTVYTISVAQNGIVVSHVTDLELVRSGYSYKSLSDCSGVVQWRNKSRAITCDTPQMGITGAAAPSRG
ncbi:MAG: zonular occludens toxin [Comamonadaceae bacterium]|nr:MAG: zonular occludens toxin [Comamonadaceae bacterium]